MEYYLVYYKTVVYQFSDLGLHLGRWHLSSLSHKLYADKNIR